MLENCQRARQPFAVMAKPAGARCNLRCGYCYYLDRGPQGPDMPLETLEVFIREYMEASPGPVVSFTWHGGEPTLAGLGFYRRAVELQKKYLPQGFECWNNLQTNGLMLDGEWCAFLAENRFDVGLSIDGCQAVHDKYRRTPAGEGTYRRTLEAAQRLRAHGVRPDLLCTVTADAADAPLEVYQGLLALDTGWMQFIPIVRRDASGAVTPDSVTPEGYGEFLCRIFDWWLLHDLGSTQVQLFAEAESVLAGGGPGLCWMAPACGRVLVVERDGSVYSCDHFVDDAHRLGRLGEDSLAAMADSPRQRAFGAAKGETLPEECRACRWRALCSGGCPKDRFLERQGGNLNYLCPGLRRFFDHAGERLARLGAYRRQGLGAGAIMERFRAEEREKWRGVGRNDPCPCGSGKKAKKCCWDRRP